MNRLLLQMLSYYDYDYDYQPHIFIYPDALRGVEKNFWWSTWTSSNHPNGSQKCKKSKWMSKKN